MSEESIEDEVKKRIQKEIKFFKGNLPENVSLVWYGYLTALLDRGIINHYSHSDLVDMLPNIEKNPSDSIFTGVPGYHLKNNKM